MDAPPPPSRRCPMPSFLQIASYSRMFQAFRGRQPTLRELRRYFDGGPSAFRPRQQFSTSRVSAMNKRAAKNVNRLVEDAITRAAISYEAQESDCVGCQ